MRLGSSVSYKGIDNVQEGGENGKGVDKVDSVQ